MSSDYLERFMGFITFYGIRCLDSMLAKNRMSHPNVQLEFSDSVLDTDRGYLYL